MATAHKRARARPHKTGGNVREVDGKRKRERGTENGERIMLSEVGDMLAWLCSAWFVHEAYTQFREREKYAGAAVCCIINCTRA